MRRILALFALLAGAWAQAYWPTGSGLLVGEKRGEVLRFMGIPYAQAGRFEAPELLELPQGRFDARRPGPACPQRGSIDIRIGAKIPPQDEDCLNLNLWIPAQAPPAEGWPVMVYIHGGSFTGGSGAIPIYDGQALAQRGVIVATFNYRLGPLGFLALPGLGKGNGNFGLLDQIAALRWIRQNIAVFGGNPRNVTVFGESAGAMSACALLTSPLAKGLFSRVILQSGGCNQVKTLAEGFEDAKTIGEALGCDVSDLDCWRKLPLERYLSLFDRIEPLFDFSKAPFKPHVDGNVLPEFPEKALARGIGKEVAMIAGANTDEYRLNLGLYLWGPHTWEAFKTLVKKRGVDPEAAEAFYRRRYPNPNDAFFAFETDRELLCPTYRAAKLHQGRTYAYLFSYQPQTWPFAKAFHGLDLAFVFNTFEVWPFWFIFMTVPELEAARPVGQLMQELWTDFAKGEPLKAGLLWWPRYEEGYILGFDRKSGWRPDPYEERCALFR